MSDEDFSNSNESDEGSYQEPDTRNKGRKPTMLGVKGQQTFEDGYGPDLIGDSRDRAYIDSLSKLDRERILLERQEARDELIKKKTLLRNANERAKDDKRKDDEMEKMKAERLKRREDRNEVSANYDNIEIDSDYDEAGNLGKRVRPGRPADRKRRERPDRNADQELEPEDDEPDRQIKESDLEFVKKVFLARGFLTAHASQQHFRHTVRGCYVKVTLNKDGHNTSKLGRIEDVNEGVAPYTEDGKTLTKSLRLKIGGEPKEQDFKITYISNKKPETSEFNTYLKELNAAGIRIPTLKDIRNKLKSVIENLRAKTTHEQIVQVVERSKEEKLRSQITLPEKKRLLEEKLQKLKYKYFQKPDAHLRDQMEDIKKQIETIDQHLENDVRGEGYPVEQPIVVVQKSNPYAFTNQRQITDSTKIHNRTIPKLHNMWSVSPDAFKLAVEKPSQPMLVATKSQQQEELQTEKGLYLMAQELKEEFLSSFDRPLSIDALVDAIEV